MRSTTKQCDVCGKKYNPALVEHIARKGTDGVYNHAVYTALTEKHPVRCSFCKEPTARDNAKNIKEQGDVCVPCVNEYFICKEPAHAQQPAHTHAIKSIENGRIGITTQRL